MPEDGGERVIVVIRGREGTQEWNNAHRFDDIEWYKQSKLKASPLCSLPLTSCVIPITTNLVYASYFVWIFLQVPRRIPRDGTTRS
jgi:hypothetical protein